MLKTDVAPWCCKFIVIVFIVVVIIINFMLLSPVVERPTSRAAECPQPQMFSMQLIAVNERYGDEYHGDDVDDNGDDDDNHDHDGDDDHDDHNDVDDDAVQLLNVFINPGLTMRSRLSTIYLS